MADKPLLLGLDTTGEFYSLALARGNQLLAECSGGKPRQHLVQLFPALNLLVQQTGERLSDCQGVAVTAGPGSFTGVRTGLLVAKTVAQFLQCPVYSLDTLEVLAANVACGESVVAALDARKGQVIWAVFRVNKGIPQPLQFTQLTSPETWLEQIPPSSLVLGSACGAYAEMLKSRDDLQVLGGEFCRPRAAHIARLGYRASRSKQGMKWQQVRPDYVRPADVQVHAGGA